MIHYLHDSVIYDTNKDITYMNNSRKTKINQNNWHNYLNIIGWEKLNLGFIKLLNRNSEQKYKNSPYGILDCGGDGDCLFHCISHALSSDLKEYYDYKDIRDRIAESIDDKIFKDIIETYKILKDSGDFDEEWNPYEIKSKEEFKDIIKEGGNNYWGDHILFQLIIRALEVNIILLRINNKDYGIYHTYQEYNPSQKTIILLYENNIHFKLIGFFKNKMITLFNDEDIPLEIKRIYSII
tara:strand:+ start:1256 stop:1972 length:717 start_codon:yes stop_codon:yes gene_type:complete